MSAALVSTTSAPPLSTGGEPLVSIVLPSHNGERFLAESIESCLAQTYVDLELLLVDDGSSDATAACMAKYARRDPRVRVLTHSERRGLPHALNTGFAAARGAFCTWTSDDNRFRPHALARLVDLLRRSPGLDIAYSDYTCIDAGERQSYSCRVESPETLLQTNPVGPSFLFRRQVARLQFDPATFLAEDYDFWLRASMQFRFAPLHEDLYLYREHANSLSARHGAAAVARVADSCLGRHLPRLAWATPRQLLLAHLRLARRAQLRHEPRGLARHLRAAAMTLVFHPLRAALGSSWRSGRAAASRRRRARWDPRQSISRLRASLRRRGFAATLSLLVSIGVDSLFCLWDAHVAALWRRALNRRFDRRMGTRTAAAERVPPGAAAGISRYEPIYQPLFRRVLGYLPEERGEFAFIDLGCGKGKAMLLAAQAGFGRIIGVELFPALAREAARNLATLTPAANVELFCMDARAFHFPDGPAVVFLYNPFGAAILAAVLDRIEASLRRRSRPVYIVYMYPRHDTLSLLAARAKPLCQHRRYAIFSALQ